MDRQTIACLKIFSKCISLITLTHVGTINIDTSLTTRVRSFLTLIDICMDMHHECKKILVKHYTAHYSTINLTHVGARNEQTNTSVAQLKLCNKAIVVPTQSSKYIRRPRHCHNNIHSMLVFPMTRSSMHIAAWIA